MSSEEERHLSALARQKFAEYGFEDPEGTLSAKQLEWFLERNPGSGLFLQGIDAILFSQDPAIFTRHIIEDMNHKARDLYKLLQSTRDPDMKATLSAQLHDLARELGEKVAQKTLGQDWERFTYDQVEF